MITLLFYGLFISVLTGPAFLAVQWLQTGFFFRALSIQLISLKKGLNMGCRCSFFLLQSFLSVIV